MLRVRIRTQGFTLIELLVVIAILGMIAAMLMPAVNAARESARRTHCQSNMRQVGLGIIQYLDLHDEFPEAAQLPSVTPEKPSLYEVLASLIESNRDVFHCPSDHDFFSKEGISYEYPSHRLEGRTRNELTQSRKLSEVTVLFDFENFHGPEGAEGSRNILYADGHVVPL